MINFSLNLFSAFLFATSVVADGAWHQKTSYPAAGRHHPITFANETHAFVLTGGTWSEFETSTFLMYDESSDSWTDLTNSDSAFPGLARSFAYGIVLNEDNHNKAYLGLGINNVNGYLTDWWEFNMQTHAWRRLAEFPGDGRRHPAMNPVESLGEIHVGLGDGANGNLKDFWCYNIADDEWTQMPDLPSTRRHHPYYFGFGTQSYAGLGHSYFRIERDFFRFEDGAWHQEADFVSRDTDGNTVTTEARVAGTQFQLKLGETGTIGLVLSGDGDDHSTMSEGEFHAFYPGDARTNADGTVERRHGYWRTLPSHPGVSRWAPGGWVMRGTTRIYFTSGYDRANQVVYDDVWMIDVESLLDPAWMEAHAPEEIETTTQVEPETTQIAYDDPDDAKMRTIDRLLSGEMSEAAFTKVGQRARGILNQRKNGDNLDPDVITIMARLKRYWKQGYSETKWNQMQKQFDKLDY